MTHVAGRPPLVSDSDSLVRVRCQHQRSLDWRMKNHTRRYKLSPTRQFCKALVQGRRHLTACPAELIAHQQGSSPHLPAHPSAKIVPKGRSRSSALLAQTLQPHV